MDIQTNVDDGVLTVEIKNQLSLRVEGTASRDTIYIGFRSWGSREQKFSDYKYMFLDRDEIIGLIRALAIVMKIQHHAIDNIIWLVEHELSNYNHLAHELRNPNRIL